MASLTVMPQPPAVPQLDGGNPRLLLIEDRLGESLAEFIAARRPATAWRRIAIEIGQRTQVDVTGEALRIWYQGVTS